MTISANRIDHQFEACQCSICRKWGGGPALVVNCGTAVDIVGHENITIIDSSNWAERAFYSKRGMHFFSRIKQHEQYIIPADFFNELDSLVFDKQLFF